ncbi:hypothetical protein SAMN05216339_1144 [Nitrosomonas eutropha]|uniref:Uncharacterized protein n=1 Tax=Nitrosomonas eutropha TaxID=916 RepID=A0A1I7J3V5_9PROT|nr:hypothetical protein SAMN05216339_1144 [Nitrosomonas eutropha]
MEDSCKGALWTSNIQATLNEVAILSDKPLLMKRAGLLADIQQRGR